MSKQADDLTRKILKTGKLQFNIEINFTGDGRTFINHWDSNTIAELKKGNLYYDNGRKTDLDKLLNRIRVKVKKDILESLKD